MSTLGVRGENIVVSRGSFEGYPGSPESSVPGGLSAAVGTFARAWRGADGALRSDVGEFATRLGKAAALYAEADSFALSAIRRAP